MSKVYRGCVPVPNNEGRGPAGNKVNSCGPMGKQAPAAKAPNAKIHDGDINNGFLPMSKKANTMATPNEKHKFSVEDARIGYDEPAVLDPGKGAIPVNPFMKTGNPALVNVPLRDTAKRGK